MSKLGKLKPEFKAKWVAALRSGEYKQGVQVLHNQTNDTYCCLGIACAVNGDEYFRMEADFDTGKTVRCNMGLPGRHSAAAWWLTLPDDNNNIDTPAIMLPGYKEPTRLTELNDEIGSTFAEIADLIEEQL